MAIRLEIDKSPKGEIDTLILPFMEVINSTTEYRTTSSCSGRISIFIEKTKTKVGRWLFVSHQRIQLQNDFNIKKEQSEYEITPMDCLFGDARVELSTYQKEKFVDMTLVYFKFEPFIMHIASDNVEMGRRFMQLCIEAGYAYTALVVSKKRTMISVKSSLKIDSPIGYYCSDTNTLYLVVNREYIALLIDTSNQKFDENELRMRKLLDHLKKNLQSETLQNK